MYKCTLISNLESFLNPPIRKPGCGLLPCLRVKRTIKAVGLEKMCHFYSYETVKESCNEFTLSHSQEDH